MSPLVPELRARVGEEIACSDWITIEQSRIDEFARATGDHYWIHTDVERVKQPGNAGTTIAHGFLTLSMIAPSCLDAVIGVLGAKQVLNYGADRLRFIAPVPCGARVRCHVTLADITDRPDGRQLIGMDCVVEIEGESRPALAARSLMLIAG
jgi:acyl dehydratase